MTLAAHARFRELLTALGGITGQRFAGDVFRSTSPRYAKSTDLISGVGAARTGGRWNPPASFPAVYTSLTTDVAVAETVAYARYFGLPAASVLPRVLVALAVRGLSRVLDLTDPKVRRRLKLTATAIRNEDWRAQNGLDREALTQALR